MSIGNSQEWIDFANQAERVEYEAWLDTIDDRRLTKWDDLQKTMAVATSNKRPPELTLPAVSASQT